MLHRRLLPLSLLASALLAAAPPAPDVAVVPMPEFVTALGGAYALPSTTTIAAATPDERNVADFLVAFLRERGISGTSTANTAAANIRLSATGHDPKLGEEGYHLRVDSSGVTIEANGGAGLFYGLQTLEQLYPAGEKTLPAIDVVDRPAFAWRGIMLDVSRHFYSVETVKRFIDLAAHYKLNRFHWHLSDDQGWRVEIRRYPRLTEVGSCRAGTEVDRNPFDIEGPRYCGFYTQQQIRDVVAYAARRYVTIVPEIDMPGHSTAAIAAYPWLGCTGKEIPVSTRWGGSYPICPTERAIAFEEGVLTELMQLFPGSFIHAGGDEVPFEPWKSSPFVHSLMQQQHLSTYPQVQAYFERRIEQFIESKGRRMVGWDEILDGGISRNAVIMSWRGIEGGIKAARLGNDAVMTPDGPLYLDAYQGDRNDEPEAIGGLSTLRMVYDYDPLARITAPDQRARILGVQGNIWTEWIGSVPYLFYMALPRELALSEIAWVAPAQKDWDSFLQRSGAQYAWLQSNGYQFRIPNPSFAVEAGALRFAGVSSSVRTITAETGEPEATISIADAVPGAAVYYTTNGAKPDAHATRYEGPIRLQLSPGQQVDLESIAVLSDGRSSTPSELVLRRRSAAPLSP